MTMQFFNTIQELQLYLSTLPIESTEIHAELSASVHQLHETWVIEHRLVLTGNTHEIDNHLFNQSKITGDVNRALIEVRNCVVFKNLLIQCGLDQDQSEMNGSTIVVAEHGFFQADHCMINTYVHDAISVRSAGVEVAQDARAELKDCQINGNQKSVGVLVRSQETKRQYPYDLILNHCQINSHLMGICAQDDVHAKISDSVIQNSVENGIYQLGAWLELYDVQVINAGRHGLALVNGKGLIKGMFVQKTHYSAISTFLKCPSNQIEDENTLISNQKDASTEIYHLVIEDLVVDEIGSSAIFLNENSRVFAKNIKAQAIQESAFKCTASSLLDLEDAFVSSCEGCSLVALDLSQMITKRVKLSAGSWGTIYLDTCAQLFLDDLIENIDGNQIDLAGAAQIKLVKHDQEMELSLTEAQANRNIWDETTWLMTLKDRSNRFEVNTRKRMAFLFEIFCHHIKDHSLNHMGLLPFMYQWGEFGQNALYPFWRQIGSPPSIVFDENQVSQHRFECVQKEVDLQGASFASDEIVGLSFANDKFLVFTRSHLYDCQIDEKTNHLVIIRKRKLWGSYEPLSDCEVYTLNVISQNMKHYLVFEYESRHASKSMMLLIYDDLNSTSQYYYLDRDLVGFYPKDDQIITFGWDLKSSTWQGELTQPTATRIIVDDQKVFPQAPWLWYKAQRIISFLTNDYQIEIVNRKMYILSTKHKKFVYQVPQANLLYFTASAPYLLCANRHELLIIKKFII